MSYRMKYTLHHIGIAVKKANLCIKYYEECFGYIKETEIYDTTQNLHAIYIINSDSRIELLEKIDYAKKSPIDYILKLRGGGIYHHCYQVQDLENAYKELEKRGFYKLVKKKFIYENFICRFLLTPDNQVVELLQYTKC